MVWAALCAAALTGALSGCGGASGPTTSGLRTNRLHAGITRAKIHRIDAPLIEAFHAYGIAADAFGAKSPHTTSALHKAMLAGSRATSACRKVPGCPVSPVEAIDRHLMKIAKLEVRLR
jgi:hypothetical protein